MQNTDASPGLANDPASGQHSCCLCSKPLETLSPAQYTKKLLRILLECLGGHNSDDDSESETDNEDTQLQSFCVSCEKYLTELDDLKNSILKLQDRFNGVKCTLLAKVLSCPDNLDGADLINPETCGTKSGWGGKLAKLKSQLYRQFIPIVVATKDLTAMTMQCDIRIRDSTNSDKIEGSGSDLDSDNNCDSGDSDCRADEDRDPPKKSRPLVKSPKKRKPPHHPTVKISPTEFLYADHHRFYRKENSFHCAACPNVSLTKRSSMLAHIRNIHMKELAQNSVPTTSKTPAIVPMENNPQEFLYLDKYVVAVLVDGTIKCPLCTVKRKYHKSMLQHIQQSHDGQINLSHPSSVEEVAPNEFVYHGKYKFHFIPNESVYACGYCDHKTPTMKFMLPHIRAEHYTSKDKEQFGTVQVGDMEFLYAGKYRIFYKDGRYVCDLCGHVQFNLWNQQAHIRAMHAKPDDPTKPKPIQTAVECAGGSVPAAPTVVKPKKSVAELPTTSGNYEYKGMTFSYDADERKYKCGQCAVSTICRDYIHLHIRTHHLVQSRNFICDICGKAYLTKPVLRNHKARHGGPQLKCKYCGKMIKTRHLFKVHVAVHEQGEEAKKYVCEYCGKRFAAKKNVDDHVRSHTGEKPCECELCGERFADSGKLFYHRKTVHGHVAKLFVLE